MTEPQHKTRRLTQSELEAFVKMYVVEHRMTTYSASDDLLRLLTRIHEDGYTAGDAHGRAGERADVVTWLEGEERGVDPTMPRRTRQHLAAFISRGDHIARKQQH